MLIEFRVHGTKVQARIDTGIGERSIFPFEWECGNEWSAQLLRDRLANRFGEAVQHLATTLRSDGYKAGRGHRPMNAWTPWHLKPAGSSY